MSLFLIKKNFSLNSITTTKNKNSVIIPPLLLLLIRNNSNASLFHTTNSNRKKSFVAVTATNNNYNSNKNPYLISNDKARNNNNSSSSNNTNSVDDTNNQLSSSSTVINREWTPNSIRVGTIARKKGMTAIWDEWGVRLPVTILQLENVQVIQVKLENKFFRPGLIGIQLGCTDKTKNVEMKLIGHFRKANITPKESLKEFLVTSDAILPNISSTFCTRSICRCFAGVMKRWNFKGMPASHGTSLSHRSAGSTGQRQDPGRVFKGKKMAGRLGGTFVTVKNLKVLKIDNYLDIIYVKGAVPGPDNSFVKIRDSLFKKGGCFPPDCLPPPFPTVMKNHEDLLNTVPRELVAKSGGTDPFIPKES
ncbi:10010_t:CDS:2 [Entrophospora sp. SA101]|nr:10010_t:CDS:2 [Entrophospora sp. SA101]CAJ0850245.1 16840_t:CDS:2 [Entrophospora sp. SA101]